MEEAKKQNTELTKYSEDSNINSGTSVNQSNWSKRNDYNPGPDYDYSRFKKSKWEWFGELIGIVIFAFVCKYLIRACFVFLLCLISVPMNAQYRYRKPNIQTTPPSLSTKVQREIAKRKQQLEEQRILLEKKKQIYKQLLKERKIGLKDYPYPVKTTIKNFDMPIPLGPQDLLKGKQLYDSALFYLSSHDTLNFVKYIIGSTYVQYPKAVYFCGVSLINGIGMKQNIARGLSYINRASELGFGEASLTIADCYYYGKYGYKRDTIMALNYFEKSATQGSLIGKIASGTIYIDRGETSRAIDYWKSACEQAKTEKLYENEQKEIAQLAYNLGCILSSNPGKEIEARNFMETSAELGYADGQALYGDYCMQGYGMERDSIQAVYWYKQAALQNHVGAMCVLPGFYYDAHENDSTILWGTKPECRDSINIQYIVGGAYYNKEDYENAEVWWKKSASQKYPDALWSMYCLCGVHKADSVLAFDYLKQAVDAKYPDALNDMGCNYANGDMVEKNIEKAKELFQEAIDLGCVKAYYNMGNMYSYKGYVKKPNWEVAVGYYRQGAEKNEPLAQYNYGWCLKKGKGVKKDKKAAIYWLKKAAKQGDEDAISDLREMGVDGF